VRAPQRPLHLLFLHKASADHLVDGQFDGRRADCFPLPPSLAEVPNELPVVAYVRLELWNTVGNLRRGG
jgi:hypothetical protein